MNCLHDGRKTEKKLQKTFIFFYLQLKRNKLISRRNLVRFLELKLKNKQRLIKACLERFVQFVNIYHQLQNLHDGGRIHLCRRHYRNVGWWNTVNTLYNEERFKQAFSIYVSLYFAESWSCNIKGRYWCRFNFTGWMLSCNTL